MAQQFGALVAPVEDSGLIPTWWLTDILNSSSRGYDVLFLPLSTRHAYDTHTYIHTCRNSNHI